MGTLASWRSVRAAPPAGPWDVIPRVRRLLTDRPHSADSVTPGERYLPHGSSGSLRQYPEPSRRQRSSSLPSPSKSTTTLETGEIHCHDNPNYVHDLNPRGPSSHLSPDLSSSRNSQHPPAGAVRGLSRRRSGRPSTVLLDPSRYLQDDHHPSHSKWLARSDKRSTHGPSSYRLPTRRQARLSRTTRHIKAETARLLTLLQPDRHGRHVFTTPDEAEAPHEPLRPHDPASPPAPNLAYSPPPPVYPQEAQWQLTPELSAKDAAEELRHVRRLQVPLHHRRCRMMHLRQVFKVGTGRAWEARPPVARLVRGGRRACRRVVSSLQMPGYFLSHISGRYGASGVAVFSFMKDLIHLNIALSLVLYSWLVAPALYQTKVLGQPLASTQGWIAQHDPAADERCPHVLITDNNHKVVNCSSIYQRTLMSDSYQSWNQTWWVLELLLGEGRYEHSLLFLGHYPVTMLQDAYPTAAVQVLAVVAVFLASLVMVVSRTGQWLRYNSSVWGGLAFSKLVFTSWDFSLRHKRSVGSKRRMLATEIRAALDEHDFQKSKSQRTRARVVGLYATRVAVNCLILLAVSLGCFVIILVTNYREILEEMVYDLPLQEIWQRETLISLVRYLDTLAVWLLGLVLPPVLSSLGSLEQYSSRVTMLLFILRSACVRLVSLGVLVASNLILVASDSSDDCRPDNPCWETTLAQNLYSQVVWDFIVRVVTTVLLLTQRLLALFFRKETLVEFNVPSRVLDILSLQTILWLSVPVSPLLPLLVLASLYLMLWLEVLVALLITKPSRHVFQVSQSSAMFMVVLAVSWVAAAATTVVIIVFIRPSLGCGPFRGLTVSWDALTHYICNLRGSTTWLRKILFALDNLEVMVSVGIVLLLGAFYYLFLFQLRLAVIRRLEKQLKGISQEKLHLMKRLKKLRDHRRPNKGTKTRHRLRSW